MIEKIPEGWVLVGPEGRLLVPEQDDITPKLAMLFEAQCEGNRVIDIVEKFGYSKQRYYQLLHLFQEKGASALQNQKRGPKSNYRRTGENTRQIIRHRFLDPNASPEVITQKMRQSDIQISIRSVERVIEEYGLQKKLYKYPPRPTRGETPSLSEAEVHQSKSKMRIRSTDPATIEREVRQLLADKVSGNLLGLWLLVPEHLRLGSWDLLVGWSAQPAFCVEPRLALQMVHESALCVTGIRQQRCLTHKGFELLNGLPFIATDTAIHQLLAEHTIQDAQHLQITLGKLRYASQHYQHQVIALDPHRMLTFSKRDMPKRSVSPLKRPEKTLQLFFALDVDTYQPIACTIGSSSLTATHGTQDLLQLITAILPQGALILADNEHFSIDLFNEIGQIPGFDLLIPASQHSYRIKKIKQIPENQFRRHWAGYATACTPYQPKDSKVPLYLFVQRNGEQPQEYFYNSFVATNNSERVHQLTAQFPKRWHVEEFFNLEQEMGWRRSGTHNLNIRYTRASFSLVAQAALHQLRKRLGTPFDQYTAEHFSQDLFQRLDGDLRVDKDTITVTYYNVPNVEALKHHYEDLPEKLQKEGVDPRVPWLYNFKLDFRFR